ncbi:MAG: bifunctional response regulator/alkaline phosphatase family protein [Bacteroidales bacterium]|nr:bifunctional response regulator/alkaline phosphatase family protein [Bacteroidales bacterium]
MEKIKILWVDDEINLLKPHIIFLEQKGYLVTTSNSGDEALDLIKDNYYDIIFLDENMPGLSGLETLSVLKVKRPNMPVVMITKSEEESLMEDAIGSNIVDYLIKPVNPNQILMSLKKNVENKRIHTEKTTQAYQADFRNISMTLSDNLTYEEWTEVYKKIIFWELELGKSENEGMEEIIMQQKQEANNLFCRFYERNYEQWLNGKLRERPVLSHLIFKEKVFPILEVNNNSLFFILIDNLRYDQWKVLQPLLGRYFRTMQDEICYSILPSTTQFARNAIFSGMLPAEIEKKYPQYWNNEGDEGTKNQYESQLLDEQLKRFGKKISYSYNKILNLNAGKKFLDNISNLHNNELNVLVYNFIDMLSHARTDMEVIRELAEDESAYRSLTVSWFEHSPLFEILKHIASRKMNVIITTDHGSVRVTNPSRLLGDKDISTNLRYKQGKALQYEKKDVFEIKDPAKIFLPRPNVSTSYVFAKEAKYFVYPNNYNYYVNFYKNTFQHGGLSMEEIMVPFLYLKAK